MPMENAFRPTGLDGVEYKPWGAHFCLFYETRDDLLDLLVPYFKAGLEHHELCLCVASEPFLAEDAERAFCEAVPNFQQHLARGQIEIVSHRHWYLQDGHFDPARVRQGWIDKLHHGLARGFVGLRIAANVSWLERQDWDCFADYEAKVDEVLGNLPILGACAYSLTRCSSAEILDVVRHHQFALARRHGVWERLDGPELQRAHEEIRILYADLERRVQERTAELAAANAQLKKEIAERNQVEAVLRETRDRLQHLSRRLLEVQEEERNHLARELHDEFGQLLAAVTLHLHAAKAAAGAAAPSHLQECSALLQRAGAQLRSLTLELRPAMLETAGLEAALRWLAEQNQQQTGIDTQVVGHLNAVSGDLAIACYRVVQEALTNIVRHGQAQHVWIELNQSASVLVLVVRDDGVGFDAARTLKQAAGQGRLGLLGMRERVQILGGSLEVDSEPGRGTRLRVSFPLAEAGE